MENISDKEKETLIKFIDDNDIPFEIVDNGIIRFHIKFKDYTLLFYNNNGDYVLVISKGKNSEYFTYKSFMQLLDVLKFNYGSDPFKYEFVQNDIDCITDISAYDDEWYKFLEDIINFEIKEDYIEYYNKDIDIYLKSPLNFLKPILVKGLFFEVHPITKFNNKETYLLKIKCNNDDLIPEYLNYVVYKNKNLIEIIEKLLKSINIS